MFLNTGTQANYSYGIFFIIFHCNLCSGLDCLSILYSLIYVLFLFCRIHKRQNRPEEALSQCEKSLQLLKDCGKPEKTTSVYRDMAAIEQDRGHLDRAIEHLSKARGTSYTLLSTAYTNKPA